MGNWRIKIKIFVDDVRNPPDPSARVCRTSDEAMVAIAQAWTRYWLKNGEVVTELSLDHDLGEKDTIDPVVDFLVALGYGGESPDYIFKEVFVHTANPPAAEDMVAKLLPYYNVQITKVPA